MNVKTKRRLSLAVVMCYIILLFSACFTTVSAAGALSDSMILDLKAFEILQGDESGDLLLDEELTRAELTKIVAKVLQMDQVHYPDDYGVIYKDVPSEHWGFPYITVLSGMGLLNGDTDGNFYPDRAVTYAETVKVLVGMLGFGIEAEEMGGYPNGYLAAATNRGVTKGVSAGLDENMTRADAMRMVYNCLDAKRLVSSYGSSSGIVAEISSKTFRDLLMGEEDDGLMELEGVVTANRESYLLAPIDDMEDWQVEIDGVLYDKGSTDIDKYLGMQVKAFVKANPTGRNAIIKDFKLADENSKIELQPEDIQVFSADRIEYTVDTETSSKTYKKNVAADAQFLYNGRMISDSELAQIDVPEIKDGFVTLVGNTTRSEINVVFINEYQSFIVDRVNAEDKKIYLADEQRFLNYKYIDLDEDRNDVITCLMDANGALLELDGVKTGDVITAYASRDKNLVKLYTCDESVTGKVTESNAKNETLKIDSETYKYESGVETDKLLGEEIIAKLNYMGKIADIEKELTTGSYAAIVDTALTGAFGSDLKLLMAIPGLIQDDVEEAEDDDPESKDVPAIAAQNEALLEVVCAAKVRFNNQSYDAVGLEDAIDKEMKSTGLKYLVVSYYTSSDGLLRSIETLERVPVMPIAYDKDGKQKMVRDGEKKYNAYEKTFGGNSNGAFGLNEKTLGICIPSNQVSDRKDYLARIDMNNGRSYTVGVYQYNKETRCPDVVVFNEEMDFDTSGSVTNKSKLAIVAEISQAINDDGDNVKAVSLMTEDGAVDTVISEYTRSEEDFSKLKRGDLIYYSLDAKNQLDGYEFVASAADITGDYYINKPEKEIYCGQITDVDYKVVSDKKNKWIDYITISGTGLAEEYYEIPRTGTPPIYVYDSRRETVKQGTNDDLLSGQRYSIILSSYNAVKAIVIIL